MVWKFITIVEGMILLVDIGILSLWGRKYKKKQ